MKDNNQAMSPVTAYLLLWFPKPSETFVFREAMTLREMGLPIKFFSLYGRLKRNLSLEMRSISNEVERLGILYLKRVHREVFYWWKKDPNKVVYLLKTLILRPWYGHEKTGENLWAFLCAFRLARRFQEEKIQHIHAPWASGPATAAWIASQLTGIPFSFTARAWDIYPPDGLLKEKIRDAILVRSETRHNIDHLVGIAGGDIRKIYLTYNGIPLNVRGEATASLTPPYQLLALGRFVAKKGYDDLLKACKILKDKGLNFRLTLAGDGPRKRRFQRLTHQLGLDDQVSFPGFLSYDCIPALLSSTDIFLMPSTVHSSGDRDGIPTVILEALAHRLPVIATGISGIPEVIEDRKTGLLVPEKDPPAIAAAVEDLVNDRESAIRMAKEGRTRVLQQFDSKNNHVKVLDLYRRALGQDSLPPLILRQGRLE
jgi:glycosyltransferase involved in cell wall biosynthesis